MAAIKLTQRLACRHIPQPDFTQLQTATWSKQTARSETFSIGLKAKIRKGSKLLQTLEHLPGPRVP
ncbi:MAG: hypothetical protein MK364_23175, partial [Pirellulales bacterium]|nr:hypothetical protein [Pirellulales bacterium]